jgi:hypothetical protein
MVFSGVHQVQLYHKIGEFILYYQTNTGSGFRVRGSKVRGSEVQGSAQSLAAAAASLIEKEIL